MSYSFSYVHVAKVHYWMSSFILVVTEEELKRAWRQPTVLQYWL